MYESQIRFQSQLATFVNGALFGRSEYLKSAVSYKAPIRSHAGRLCKAYREIIESDLSSVDLTTKVQCEPYRWGIIEVEQIAELLEPIADRILACVVHGSLGTYETVNYSDFDALVILKDSAFSGPRSLGEVGARLCDCLVMMRRFDPLQHHGWFVLTEFDLARYSEAFLPIAVLQHSKSILGDQVIDLDVGVRESRLEFVTAALSLVASIQRTSFGEVFQNQYSAKVFLSKLLLLPAVYIQAIEGVGTLKKASFGTIERYLDGAICQEIEKISAVRACWTQELTAFQRYMYTMRGARRKLAERFLKIPPTKEIQDRLLQLDLKVIKDSLGGIALELEQIQDALKDGA